MIFGMAEDHRTATARTSASYRNLHPASAKASATARGASRKRDTRCELALRRALWAMGLRYRVDSKTLPGRPDIVFARARVAVFCDGDFWHGRNLDNRLARLAGGHNAPYWLTKLQRNVERDRRHDAALSDDGWMVLRFWEKDILADPAVVARRVAEVVASRR